MTARLMSPSTPTLTGEREATRQKGPMFEAVSLRVRNQFLTEDLLLPGFFVVCSPLIDGLTKVTRSDTTRCIVNNGVTINADIDCSP